MQCSIISLFCNRKFFSYKSVPDNTLTTILIKYFCLISHLLFPCYFCIPAYMYISSLPPPHNTHLFTTYPPPNPTTESHHLIPPPNPTSLRHLHYLSPFPTPLSNLYRVYPTPSPAYVARFLFPVIYQPIQADLNQGETCWYTDGGMLDQYPIHCFDG